ncbi:MAG TPA: cysteine synthase A [Candidatus Saccharimonadales bacterium]|nr:cysteine synthase A [Candidatus Saccharimonadales bacterium]
MKCSMRVVDSVLDLIGSTPMVRLRKVVPENAAEIWVKLEAFNPGFSIKDRAALGMVEQAEREGVLHPGDTIVEATAGNTGVGLALVGVQKGYKVVFFVPEKFSKEKVMLMECFGAKVHRTPTDEGMEGAISRAKQLVQENEDYWFAAQFSNPGNPLIHHDTTGREIWEQTEGRIDAFVCGAGTAGTFTGVARYLKEQNPKVQAILSDTQNSVYSGQTSGAHDVEGIGASFIPETFDPKVCDGTVIVSDVEAFAMVKRLAVEEGVLGGSSSGANVCGAIEVAKRLGKGKRVITLIPDSAERYLSKDIFNYRGAMEAKPQEVSS